MPAEDGSHSLYAAIIAVPVAIFLGVLVALYRNTVFDRVANVVTLTVGDELSGEIAQYSEGFVTDADGNVVAAADAGVAADAAGDVVAGGEAAVADDDS